MSNYPIFMVMGVVTVLSIVGLLSLPRLGRKKQPQPKLLDAYEDAEGDDRGSEAPIDFRINDQPTLPYTPDREPVDGPHDHTRELDAPRTLRDEGTRSRSRRVTPPVIPSIAPASTRRLTDGKPEPVRAANPNRLPSAWRRADRAPAAIPTASDAEPLALRQRPLAELPASSETARVPAAPWAWLHLMTGDGANHPVVGEVTSVGSTPTCDIVLRGDGVAARHLTVRRVAGAFTLHAHAPTTLNGEPIRLGRPYLVESGALVTLGSVELVVSMDQPQLRWLCAGQSVTGGRERNEDAYHVSAGLIAVADGLGGRPAGELAANLAVSNAVKLGPTQDVRETVARINRLILQRAATDPTSAGMATTLDLAVLQQDDRGQFIRGTHIGDGMVLVQDGQEPVLLTREHTVAAERFAAGIPVESNMHGDVLMRAIGIAEDVRGDLWERPAATGDRYVLASDGLKSALGGRGIQKALIELRKLPPEDCVHELMRRVTWVNPPDNVTIVVADLIETTSPGEDPQWRA